MSIVSDRLVTTYPLAEDKRLERSTRPTKLSEYIGQTQVREQMALFIQAATTKEEPLDHVLVAGPPGLGKTTLANIIAREIRAPFKTTSGPILEKAGDLAAILTHLEPNSVLFIDEIHRINPAIEEILYPALEDYQLDILIGEGPSARSIKIDLPPFTLIGATTRTGLLTPPLRDRFGIIQNLSFYTTHDLARIIMRAAHLLNIIITEEGALTIAERSRGTPRIANRLLRRTHDFSLVKGNSEIDQTTADRALGFLSVDRKGFDSQDRNFLLTIIHQFGGGPVGIESLAAAIGESQGTIEEVIEPYLIQQGFISRTRRGRVASMTSYEHFKLKPPAHLREAQQMTLDAYSKSESN